MKLKKENLYYQISSNNVWIKNINSEWKMRNDEEVDKTRVVVFPSHIDRQPVTSIWAEFYESWWGALKKIMLPKSAINDSLVQIRDYPKGCEPQIEYYD